MLYFKNNKVHTCYSKNNRRRIFNSLFHHLPDQELNRKWSDVRQLVPQRDNTLAAELRKQQNNEALRRQFAEKANAVGPWIERQMDAVTAIGMGLQVTLNNSNLIRVSLDRVRNARF